MRASKTGRVLEIRGTLPDSGDAVSNMRRGASPPPLGTVRHPHTHGARHSQVSAYPARRDVTVSNKYRSSNTPTFKLMLSTRDHNRWAQHDLT